MTSKERVMMAFNHEEPDRVPLGELHIMSHAASQILQRDVITGEGGAYMKMAEYLSRGERDAYVERITHDTLDLIKTIGHDLINTELDPPGDGSLSVELTPTGWKETDLDTGYWRLFNYESEYDTVTEVDSTEKSGGFDGIKQHLEILENKKRPLIHDSCFDSTREICRKAGDQLFCMAKIPNVIPSNRSWYTDFMELLLLDPETAHRLCDCYTEYGLAAAKEYIDCGVHAVMIASDWAINTGPFFPPYVIEEFLVPQINTIADYCHDHGVKVMKHTDGNIMQIADVFFNMHIDAYQGIEPYAGMELGLVKEKYGKKVTLMGNVDCGRTLPFGTKEEIIAETKACIKAGALGGGYILSSSNTISYPISGDALLTMIETAMNFGKYPIE